MKKCSEQSGYTLLESIAFICIITMVAISIISVISHMLDRYRISRVTSQVTELQRSIINRCAAAESYYSCIKEYGTTCVAAMGKMLCTENLVPGDMECSGNTLYHKYGGKVTFNSYGDSARGLTSGYNFRIDFASLPKNACIELATQNWAHDQYSNLIRMHINGTECTWRSTWTPNCVMPISNVKASELCNKNEKNTIYWNFQ